MVETIRELKPPTGLACDDIVGIDRVQGAWRCVERPDAGAVLRAAFDVVRDEQGVGSRLVGGGLFVRSGSGLGFGGMGGSSGS